MLGGELEQGRVGLGVEEPLHHRRGSVGDTVRPVDGQRILREREPENVARRPICLPVAAGYRQFDLAVDEIDDCVDDLVLVGDVVIHRHRFDAELGGERTDGQRPDPADVGDGDRPGQNRSRLSGTRSLVPPVTDLNLFS